jgi:hypothetical protein
MDSKIPPAKIVRVSAGITQNGYIVLHQTAIFYRPVGVKLILEPRFTVLGFAFLREYAA